MMVVGLTGGIGSGKSAVAEMFRELGAPIIDTDVIAREVVQPGSDALNMIVQRFGDQVLKPDGHLDRSALRHAVFNSEENRRWLEQLLHPLIRERTKQLIDECDYPYCIVVIPLLAENWPYPLVDRVLVVDIDEEVQLKRASQRDKNTDEQIKKIMKSQTSREQRLAIADDVINNDADLEHLRKSVRELHNKYLNTGSSLSRG